MSAMLPLPTGLSFEEWAAVFVEQYAGESPERPQRSTDWRAWGSELLQMNPFAEIPVPNAYPDWRPWAENVINTLWTEE